MSLDFTTVKVIAASLATTVKVVNPTQRVAVSQPNAPVVVVVRAPGGFRGPPGPGANIIASATPPDNPSPGTLWLDIS